MTSSPKNNDKNQSIAIIGAGPAGLSAAEALKEKGYQNITVFETRSRVGGMALSRSYKDAGGQEVIYELGSVQPFGSKKLFDLFERYHIHTGKKSVGDVTPFPIRIYCLEDKNYVVDFLNYKFGLSMTNIVPIMSDVLKLSMMLYRHRRLSKPGFGNMRHQELGLPVADWLVAMQLHCLYRTLNVLFSGPFNGSSYDIRHDHCTADAIKYLLQAMKSPVRYINGHYVPITEGYQSIWLEVAKQHNVKLNSHIEKITRHEKGSTLLLDDGSEHTFDKLIVACPAIKLMDVMDVDEPEISVFNKMRFVGGWKVAFTAKNLPHDGLYIFIDQMENPNQSPILPGFIPEGELSDGAWLYTSMVGLNTPEGIDEAIDRSVQLYQEHFGATDFRVVEKCFWEEYKCHFVAGDVATGIYDRFEGLQGQKNTFYCGEQLSSSSNGLVVDYSYDLVDRYF